MLKTCPHEGPSGLNKCLGVFHLEKLWQIHNNMYLILKTVANTEKIFFSPQRVES